MISTLAKVDYEISNFNDYERTLALMESKRMFRCSIAEQIMFQIDMICEPLRNQQWDMTSQAIY